MKILTAKNLKQILWETLNDIKGNKIGAMQGDAIATQAREILRTTNTQLRIASQIKHDVSKDVVDFAEKQ